MCVAATARRRRRQVSHNMNHLAPRQRPNRKKSDSATSKKRLMRLMETERRIKQGKK